MAIWTATKTLVTIEHQTDWTSVDVSAAVAGTPADVKIELTQKGNGTLFLRSADGAAELEINVSSGSSSISSTTQVDIPLVGGATFEYKFAGGDDDITAFVIAHA